MEPVTILKVYQKNFLRGCPLDPKSESSYSEGPTTEIFVSHMNLYADAMDELLSLNEPVDRSVPLEVTFTGEFARDFGGPRREFLSSMLRLIKEKLCIEQKDDEGGYVLEENLTALRSRCYLGAGLIFGKKKFFSSCSL